MARPPKYDSAKELTLKIEEFFEDPDCDNTITGLCLHLGYASRQSFYDLEKSKEFSYTIKRARLRIENAYERMLKGQSVTGPIFALKNLGWSDKQELEHSGKLAQLTKEELLSEYERNQRLIRKAGLDSEADFED